MSEAQVQELQRQLASLQSKNQGLEEELKAKQVVKVVQTSQKLRRYSGDPRDLNKWIADCQRQVNLQSLSERNAVDFILSHLDGDAEDEVKFDLKEEDITPSQIYSILTNAFGEQVTAADVLDLCYNRQQGERETLRDYGFALMRLAERALSLDEECIANKDSFVRDRFVQKVRDRHLRDHLRAEIRKNKTMRFRDVREEAVRYAEEDKPSKGKRVSCHTIEPAIPTELAESHIQEQEVDMGSLQDKIDKLLELQLNQQKQIAAQQEQITNQQRMIADLTKGKPQKPEAKKDVCHFCGRTGHWKRQCYKWKASQRRAPKDDKSVSDQVLQFVPAAYSVPPWQPPMYPSPVGISQLPISGQLPGNPQGGLQGPPTSLNQ